FTTSIVRSAVRRRMPPDFQAGDLKDRGFDAAAPLTMTTRPVDSNVIITVRGEIDMSNRALFQDRLVGEIRRNGPRLSVDLTSVNYMGAAALTVLLAVEAGVRASGGHGMSIVACTYP